MYMFASASHPLFVLIACLAICCSYDKTLPDFLKPFTALSVYTRIINQGVELLQRRKEYTEAVAVLRKLLSQQVYCVDYRGHWWERLALNYDAHLKNQEKVSTLQFFL
jgi:Fanconi-associated nuclease 1